MGIALLSAARLVQVMPVWIDWLKPRTRVALGRVPQAFASGKPTNARRPEAVLRRAAGGLWAMLGQRSSARGHAHTAPAAPRGLAHARPLRPLRVLRVLEPQQPRSAAGRMVISGSMADVCAELDRLAAAEMAASQP